MRLGWSTVAGGISVALRVLIVDDEPDIRQVLRLVLEKDGCEVIEEEGAKGIVRVARRQEPDVILLDVMMPGVDGFEAVEALQGDKRTRDIPIAMLTALGDMDSIQRAIDAGATGYLTKPFSVELLHGQVLAIIEKAKEDSGQKLVDYPNVV
ncbi:two-component system response regulator [Candidatus Poribacteria bacterium]|nr:two-component system response regulator [Candidatus Poribacteria bacterium]